MDISWYHFTAGRVLQNMEAVDWAKIHQHLPLETMDEASDDRTALEGDVRSCPAGRVVGAAPLPEQV